MSDPRKYSATIPDENHVGDCATGSAVSGRLLAFATLGRQGREWYQSDHLSGQFHLGETSPSAIRKFAADVHRFVSQVGIGQSVFCRTTLGEGDHVAADEARIEGILCLIPGLEIEILDEDTVLQWVVRENPSTPRNVLRRNLSVAQLRAIELAQYDQAAAAKDGFA